MRTRKGGAGALFLIGLVASTAPALAQYAGDNLRGDRGLFSGTQPPEGWHVSAAYSRFVTHMVRDRSGGEIDFGEGVGEAVIQTIPVTLWRVTDRKLFGATYGLMIVPSLSDNSMEAPALGLDDETGFGLGDLYFQPINLGWHLDRIDVTAGLGVYAPTGLYQSGADDNTGLGMWGGELSAGATLFLDAARSWSLASTAFWETHLAKKHTSVKIGDLLTIEGGLGRSFYGGAATAGIAWYGQWKLGEDDRVESLGDDLSRHRVYAAGPEVILPLPTRAREAATLSVRGLLEFNADSTTEGSTLQVTLSFPLPGAP